MDQNGIFASDIMLELADRLQERLAFDITDRTTYFNNRNLCIFTSIIAVKSAFDLICDMWNDLNRTSTCLLYTSPSPRD